MNLLESQVSDLSYLANLTPLPLDSAVMNGRQSASSNAAESPASNSNGKRKADEGGTSTRKRQRYITQACNECKRRKIKCNGNTPCHRCGNLNLECVYAPNCCANGNFKDSEDFKRMNTQIASLQEQVDGLFAALNALRNGDSLDAMNFSRPADGSMPANSLTSPYRQSNITPRQPRFQGPTSSAAAFEVAKSTLHSMGYTDGAGDDGTVVDNDTPLASPPLGPARPSLHEGKDPIWAISKDEAVRLCRVYEEEMGIMYPVIDIEQVIRNTTMLYSFLGAVQRSGLAQLSLPGADAITDPNTNLLKLVLACATTVEGSGLSEMGAKLFQSVREPVDNILHSGSFDIKDLPLLVLCAMYHFHCDQEALAWRIIGHTARMCMELGLHRRDAFLKRVTTDAERTSVTKLFWSIYVLDRRWSFGTGMPFAIQDADIDDTLPEPDASQTPYLCTMISYSRIGSTVWKTVGIYESQGTSDVAKKTDLGYLDYRIMEWTSAIPPELKLPTTDAPHTSSRAMHRLQILLYLRANQMRILIYRPVLHSANSIIENMAHATTVVELAKDTIRALTHLNQTTDIYRTQQVCFNYFLVSAVAVLFLAVVHSPATFSGSVRDEWAMATELVRGFREGSWVSKRLWRTFKGLRDFVPKLGLTQDAPTIPTRALADGEEDPHSSAALAMAGLAGFGMGDMSSGNSTGTGHGMAGAVGGMSGTSGDWENSMNGMQMSHEMTNLFEAALGVNGYNGDDAGNGSLSGGINAQSGFGGADDDLYRHLKELF